MITREQAIEWLRAEGVEFTQDERPLFNTPKGSVPVSIHDVIPLLQRAYDAGRALGSQEGAVFEQELHEVKP